MTTVLEALLTTFGVLLHLLPGLLVVLLQIALVVVLLRLVRWRERRYRERER